MRNLFLTRVIANVQAHLKNPSTIRRTKVLQLQLFEHRIQHIYGRTVPLRYLDANMTSLSWTLLLLFAQVHPLNPINQARSARALLHLHLLRLQNLMLRHPDQYPWTLLLLSQVHLLNPIDQARSACALLHLHPLRLQSLMLLNPDQCRDRKNE